MNRLPNPTLMSRLAIGAAGVVGSLTLQVGTAHAARTLVYYQDWSEDSAFNSDWISTNGCTTYSRDPAIAFPGGPIVEVTSVTPPAPQCSGRYESETIRWSGGRSSARKSIGPVAANERYCVTSWIRANGAGAARARPYVGLNFSTSATGFPDDQGSVGGCNNGEHWLIGDPGFSDNEFRDAACVDPANTSDNCCHGRSTQGYGGATPIDANSADWKFYAREFSVKASDVINNNKYMILKLQNFSDGGSDSCSKAASAAADFDDLRVYKLTGDSVCPAQAEMTAEGDDLHASCGGNTPFCVSTNVNVTVSGEPAARAVPQTSCGKCTAGYGTDSPTACGADAPGCTAAGACAPCNGDAGTAATAICGTNQPVCGADFKCKQCNVAADCAAVAGVTRGGANCVNHACTDSCTITPADGTSATCGASRYCLEGAGGGCFDKLPNGSAIPSRAQDPANTQGRCWFAADNVTRATASLFCASGTCSKADDLCGLANGDACTAANGAAQCRSGVCGADNKCGLPDGAACVQSKECRDNNCDNGNCGGQPKECTTDDQCTVQGQARVCDASFHCVIGCHETADCFDGKICDLAGGAVLGKCIVDPNGNASSSSGGTDAGASSSSGQTTTSSSSSGQPTSSSSGQTTSSSGTPSGSSTSGTSGTPNGSSGTTSGDTGDDTSGDDDGGGCSTTGGGAGSLTPMLIGLGLAIGAFRRRRPHA